MDFTGVLRNAWDFYRRHAWWGVLRVPAGSNFLLAVLAWGIVLLLRFLSEQAQRLSTGDLGWFHVVFPTQALWGILQLGGVYLFVSFLDTLCRVALHIRITQSIANGRPENLIGCLGQSFPFFWRVRRIGFILGMPMLLVSFLLALSLLLTLGLALLCLIPLLPFVFLVDWFFSSWSEASLAVCVYENRKVVECLREGRQRLRVNWKSLLLVAMVLKFGFGLVTFTIFTLGCAVPLGFLAYQLFPGLPLLSVNTYHLGQAAVLISLVPFLFINTLVTTFVDTTWTVASTQPRLVV